MDELASLWRNAERAGRLALLEKARAAALPLSADLLGADLAEFDELASVAGFVPVWLTKADMAGQSERIEGAVIPSMAGSYPARRIRTAGPSAEIHAEILALLRAGQRATPEVLAERLTALLAPTFQDARRFEILMTLLQAAYEGCIPEVDGFSVYCDMASGFKNYRNIQADLRWTDERDAPLGLPEVLDRVGPTLKI